MGKFTTKAGDYVPPSGDDVWIKGLKQGDNRVRILQPTNTFDCFREHYAEGPGFFMCDETKKCPGCLDPNEKVQKRTRKWAFNAIEQNGRLSVFKIGAKLFGQLEGREQRNNGTLLDRDWILVREGTGLQTSYYPEAGDKYEIEWPTAIYDVENAVARKYFEACEAFGVAPNIQGDASEVWMAPYSSDTKVQVNEDKELTVDDIAVKTATPANEQLDQPQDSNDPDTWPTLTVKAFLDERKIEYPARAPRTRLVEYAREALDKPNF